MKISRQLARNESHSAENMIQLVLSCKKLGNVSFEEGDLNDARSYFGEGLEIVRELARKDPRSAEKKRELGVSYSNLASVAEKASDPTAHDWWRQCLAVFDDMIAVGQHLSPNDLKDIQSIREKLDGKSAQSFDMLGD